MLLKPAHVEKPLLPRLNSRDEIAEYPEKANYIFTKHDSDKPVYKAKKGVAAREPGCVMTVFKRAATENRDCLALESNEGQTWTWGQYYNDTITAGKALIELGFKRFDSVSLIGFNSPQWFIGNMGAIAAGGKAAGIS